MSAKLPNWVRNNPEKYFHRMTKEMEVIRSAYKFAEFYLDNDFLYIEVIFLTRSFNQYVLRIYYPENYPYEPPTAHVLDPDVIQYCTGPAGGMHNLHNYGVCSTFGGLKLCVINPSDNGTIGQGWNHQKMTGKTILERAALWLHAYEVKRLDPSKPWALPE